MEKKEPRYLYVTDEEYLKYSHDPDMLERIDSNRALAHDGFVEGANISESLALKTHGYLYITDEEYERYKDNPDLLESIDETRALAHDGITYETPAEAKRRYENEVERKSKLSKELIEIYEKKLQPDYCPEEENAKLFNPNDNVQFDSNFIARSKESLVGRWYKRNSKNTNYQKIERMLDSLKDVPNAYTIQICKIVSVLKDKLDNIYNPEIRDYCLCENCAIILAMIIEKGYKFDESIVNYFVANGYVSENCKDQYYNGYFLNFLNKMNMYLYNAKPNLYIVDSIVPNPVNFVSDVSGKEFIDVCELMCQIINAFNFKHRISDDRNSYVKGKVEVNVPDDVPTINNIQTDILEDCDYIRCDGRYGYYKKYTNIPYGKTLVIDELTGIVCKIVYYTKEEGKTEINNPSFEDIENWYSRRIK